MFEPFVSPLPHLDRSLDFESRLSRLRMLKNLDTESDSIVSFIQLARLAADKTCRLAESR